MSVSAIGNTDARDAHPYRGATLPERKWLNHYRGATLPERKWLNHSIPLRVSQYVDNPIYFITVCLNRRWLHGREARPAPPFGEADARDAHPYRGNADARDTHPYRGNADVRDAHPYQFLPYEEVLAAIRFYHEKGKWFINYAVVMPDHVHFLIQFPTDSDMVKLFQNWKAYLARKCGIDWQLGMFEHRIRSDEEFVEKFHYCRQNPVAWGLVEQADDWPYQFNGCHDFADGREARPAPPFGNADARDAPPYRGNADARDAPPYRGNADARDAPPYRTNNPCK